MSLHNPARSRGRNRAVEVVFVALLSVSSALAAAGCGDSGDGTDGGLRGSSGGGGGGNNIATRPWPMKVANQVQLLSSCSGPSLTFFQGETPVDVPYATTKLVPIPQLFGAYEIGFQINGWYWRCDGARNCPNPNSCQNPDNAGQVAIRVSPGGQAGECTAAELVKNFDSFTCDSSVPNASEVLTVTLEDPGTCLVRIETTGLASLDATAGCCDCHTCTAPAGQRTHCM